MNIKENEKLLIQGDITTYPLMLQTYKHALKLGAFPQVRIGSDELRYLLLQNGNEKQIQYTPQNHIKTIETVDAMLHIWGEANTRMFTDIPAEKIRLEALGKKEFKDIYLDRVARNELRWCGTLFPNHANAQEASMSTLAYEDFVYTAGNIDEPDPVEKWKEVERIQNRICDYLDTKKELHIVSKDTDLRLSIQGRKWINCCGKVNFPDGEVFTGPVENSAEGHIRFSFPGIFAGNEIEDIRLTFKEGAVVEAHAAKGENLLKQLIESDPGARRIGEIAVGTNYNINRFTRHMLFDEKIGGTVHLALGYSIPESRGVNKSVIHWDMLCDMRKGGKIYADNTLIYENGSFIIE